MKFIKFNLTPKGVILHVMTIFINLQCCQGNLFVMNVSRNRKMKKLAYLPGYWLDLAQIWCRGYFWIVNPKSTIKFLYDVILTSKWREDILSIYCLQETHMTSLWRHLLFKFLENVNLSSYDRLSPNQVWFDLDEGNQSYRGGRNPPPPQVENVLNRPGEIGLRKKNAKLNPKRLFSLFQANGVWKFELHSALLMWTVF